MILCVFLFFVFIVFYMIVFEKLCFFVFMDIENELDDVMLLVWFLVYVNYFDIEGFVVMMFVY